MPSLNCCFKRSRLARAEALAEDGPDGASEEAGLAPVIDPQGVVLISETAEDTGAHKEVGLTQDVGGASEERPCTSRKASELQGMIEDRPIRTSRVSSRSSLRASEDLNHVLGRLEQLDDERQALRQQLQRLQVSQIMEEADPGSVRMSSSAGSSSAQPPRFSQTSGRSRDSIGISASPTATSPTATSSPTTTSSHASSHWQPRGSGRMSIAASARASFRLADVPEDQQRELTLP